MRGMALALACGMVLGCAAAGAVALTVPARAPAAYDSTAASMEPGGTSASGPTWVRTNVSTSGIELHGYFYTPARWRRLQSGATAVPVCWENPSELDAAERALVRSAIEATWQAHSRLIFLAWGQCTDQSKGIRIRIEDVAGRGPHTLGLGSQLDGAPQGMTLNFRFRQWGVSCSQDETTRLACIRSIAVHEFGHAIGFAHEQNRHDRPGECLKEPQGPDGNVTLTAYDIESVMDYCNPRTNNDGVLSAGDIVSVQRIYGAPT